MKSINESDGLWTKLSVKEVDTSEYQAACCLNIRINKSETLARSGPEIRIEDEAVSPDFLRSVLKKAEEVSKDPKKEHKEDIKAPKATK